ncbi:MAG: PH domain-containing protein [Saprospiraceae bacterium]|nr:PH domain-containing protein [Bacteroidia bacterium]NNE13449.1 PH domain-containing protein [Saprospiraceae bacterium]NNL93818.1 PH domain-containing protein [Saprospiraceae bacterium]
MKKSEPYDFSKPTRQSYAAILIIMYRLYKVIIKQLIPVFVVLLFKGEAMKSPWFIYSIIIIAVIGAVYSIIAFFKYYFYINGNKLVVEQGVFKKSKLEIPFDRIQSVNTEQNLIHQLFKVVKLNMDTAGSAGNELQLNALDLTLASQLNEKILKHKSTSNKVSEVKATNEEKKIIFKLGIGQLLKVGITENHIRSGGVLIFFFFYVFDSLEDFGVEILEKSESYMPIAQELVQSLIVVLVVIILFAIVSFLISLTRTVLKFYNLHMYRKGEGFVIVSGLFNKKERAAKDEKIQSIRWSQNLLQKMSNIYEVLMKQAASQEVGEVKSFKVVGLTQNDVRLTQQYVFKEHYNELNLIPLNSINHYYFTRRLFIWSYIFLPIITMFYYFENFSGIGYTSFLYFLAIGSAYLSFKKKKFGLGNTLLRIDGGTFGRKSTAMPLFKIQNIKISETPFQRRRKLGSLTIYSASGSIKIPEIAIDMAKELKNYLLLKVEISKEKWM